MKTWTNLSSFFGVLLLIVSPLTQAIGVNSWVSASSTQTGNGESRYPSMSADGRYIVFASDANNLLPGDNNSATDVFLKDRHTGKTKLISRSTSGIPGNAPSREPVISADGRFVAFTSTATNLVASDNNVSADIFIHDLESGKTRRVSVNSQGQEANNNSLQPSISANGRYVAFTSWANNLINNDPNYSTDIYVHDTVTGKTTWGSVDKNGGLLPWIAVHSQNPSISNDGRYIVYESDTRDTTCTPAWLCKVTDIYRFDRNIGKASQVDVNPTGQPANSYSLEPNISGNGRYVAFLSYASDLVKSDNNNITDVFVRDMSKGTTERVSVNSQEQEALAQGSMLGPWGKPGLSTDGRYVSFDYDADNLAVGATGYQIYLRDRIAGNTHWLSRTNNGTFPDGNYNYGQRSDVSAEGRYVAFESNASNLVQLGFDNNGASDVFVHDLRFDQSKQANMQVTQTDNADPVKPGQLVTYRMVVKNFGKIAAANASLVAIPELPVGASVVKITTNKGQCQQGGISVCKLGELAAGSSTVVSLQIKLQSLPVGKLPKGSLANRASVYADPFDPALGNNRSVEKTALAAN